MVRQNNAESYLFAGDVVFCLLILDLFQFRLYLKLFAKPLSVGLEVRLHLFHVLQHLVLSVFEDFFLFLLDICHALARFLLAFLHNTNPPQAQVRWGRYEGQVSDSDTESY